MTLVSSKETQKIFLTTKTKITHFVGNLEIIISPEFYWVRKFEIPVKTETQARHVLPTLFEDIIDDTSTLTYQVIKLEENIFLCFAYNNKKIYETIKTLNIPISNISSIYFAQNECQNFKSFKVDELKFMYTSEGILIKVPNNLLDDVMDLKKVINNIKLSTYKLQIKLYNDVVNTKYYYLMFLFFALLIVTNIIKYVDFSSQINKNEVAIEKLKKISKLPSSMIQTNSILSKYDKSIKKENKKREAIAYVLSNRNFDLKSLNIENETLNLEYLSVDKNKVDDFLSKKYKILSSSANSFVLKVRIKL
ncbi:hypothetical protein [Arcobacter sp. LA11]|uniref:hypothetical protein n=1 Tax=Arcobacter sp. LA11 TaxID=1898176 RepID=UPI0009356291|nr:hypothetical protein [Arcobacter sp. LA11]